MKRYIALLLTVAWLPAAASARTWTSVSGSTLEAEYAGRDGAAVVLERADGKKLSIDIEKLSEADREFLQSLDQPAEEKPEEAGEEEAEQAGEEKPAAEAEAPPEKEEPLFGFITYAPPPPLTTEEFPEVTLRQADTATHWGFQYGPSADDVLYVVFDQPTMMEMHDTAYFYSPGHPKYNKPVTRPGKKGKFQEERVLEWSDIVLEAKHGDVTATYDLEFIYGIERADILTVFINAQLTKLGATSKFLTGAFINEEVVFEGTIPVVQALRPTTFSVGTKNEFGTVRVTPTLRMGGWHLVPKSGMDKTILIQLLDPESGKRVEKLKIEFSEEEITDTRHGGAKIPLEKPKPGRTYTVAGSIDLGPVLGVATNSTTLKMPEEKDDDEDDD